MGTRRLVQEEDLLVFLPSRDPDVQLFERVSRTFGALRVALIGVEAPPGKDVFDPDVLARLQRATDGIRNVRGVDRVLSLTTVADVVPSTNGAGVELTQLVAAVPKDEAEVTALRKKAMSRPHIVGNLVSTDGRAALILVFLADAKTSTKDGGKTDSTLGERAVISAIESAVRTQTAELPVYFGGAAFAGRAIYEEAQQDVRRLSPIALLVLLGVVLISFRDPIGVALTIVSVAVATLLILGGMGWVGTKFTIATSTLPVILFASGSSYAVHLLGRYYLLSRGKSAASRVDSLVEAGRVVGPPLLIAATTTAVGFFSFVFTDVAPMRSFGLGAGFGVLLCWLVACTLVPAVVALWPGRAQSTSELSFGPLGRWLDGLWSWAVRHRAAVVVGLLLVGLAFVAPATRVTVRMEPRGFFRVGSTPWLADKFLDDRFGGATFVQVAVHGEFTDPATIRQVERLTMFARTLPGVTQVQSITQPLRLVEETMGGGNRLPLTAPQAANLYFFLEGEAGLAELLAPGRHDALIHIRMRGEAGPVSEALTRFVNELPAHPTAPTHHDVADRLEWFAQANNGHPDRGAIDRLVNVLAQPGDLDPEVAQARETSVLASLDEGGIVLPATKIEALKDAAREGPEALHAEVVRVTSSIDEAQLINDDVVQRVLEARQKLAVTRAQRPALTAMGLDAAKLDASSLHDVDATLDDLFADVHAAPAAMALSAEVAGEPVLDRGFSRSVGHNLNRSLLLSVCTVLVLLYFLFRSVAASLLCMGPSLLCTAILFGVMGLFGLHIDLGTSLVAGIATGAGSDFAMHYVFYLRGEEPSVVNRTVGPILIVSILVVSLGFFVLALGRSPVMHLFGALAGCAMALSALGSTLLVPALFHTVRRTSSMRSAQPVGASATEGKTHGP